MQGQYRRALVTAAATNPLVWCIALLAIVVAMCALVVAMYVVAWALIHDQLSAPSTTEPATVPPAEDDAPLTDPTPGFDAHLDEHGRVELVVQELEPVPAAPTPAAPEPTPDRAPRKRKGGRKKGATSATQVLNDLSHEDLLQMAHEAGFRNANKRWTRAKLLALLAVPCSPTGAR